MLGDVVIEGLAPTATNSIAPLVSSLSLSWTLDAVSQLTMTVIDKDLRMFNANYFQRRRGIFYGGTMFEIAAVELSQGSGASPQIKIEARTRSIQLMKRDKDVNAYSNASGLAYAQGLADKYGLKLVGKNGATKKAIIQANSDTTKESAWDVLRRLAGEDQSVVFEASGTLYYAPQEWLVGKWGNLTLRYPMNDTDPYRFIEIPTCRESDDDISSADFSASLHRTNAVNLRPGMTVNLSGLGEFDKQYLITEVSYDEGVNTPVSISGRTPEKLEAK